MSPRYCLCLLYLISWTASNVCFQVEKLLQSFDSWSKNDKRVKSIMLVFCIFQVLLEDVDGKNSVHSSILGLIMLWDYLLLFSLHLSSKLEEWYIYITLQIVALKHSQSNLNFLFMIYVPTFRDYGWESFVHC